MRYIHAKHKLWEREEVCRIYITDSLKQMTGAGIRYCDFFKPQETRTAPEIIENIRGKIDGLI